MGFPNSGIVGTITACAERSSWTLCWISLPVASPGTRNAATGLRSQGNSTSAPPYQVNSAGFLLFTIEVTRFHSAASVGKANNPAVTRLWFIVFQAMIDDLNAP